MTALTHPKMDGGSAVEKPQEVARRCVAYLRTSVDHEDGMGLEIQEAQIRSYLTKHPDLKLVKIYRDKGVSGSLLARPALNDLMADAKEHRFGVALVARYDRVARDLAIMLFIEKTLLVENIQLLSVSESFNGQDPVMVAMRQIIGVFAQLERGRITERLLSGRRMKHSEGRYAGGRPCTGFVAKNHELVVDPEGAKVIRYLRKLRMARLSFARIASRLNAEKVKTRNGAKWYASGVHRLLRCPTLRGKISYGSGTCRAGIQTPI